MGSGGQNGCYIYIKRDLKNGVFYLNFIYFFLAPFLLDDFSIKSFPPKFLFLESPPSFEKVMIFGFKQSNLENDISRKTQTLNFV